MRVCAALWCQHVKGFQKKFVATACLKNPCNQLLFAWYRLTFCLDYPFLYKKDRLRQSVASHLDFARCFGTKSKEDFCGASEKMLRNLTALVLPTWKSPPDQLQPLPLFTSLVTVIPGIDNTTPIETSLSDSTFPKTHTPSRARKMQDQSLLLPSSLSH